jgi:hypothetical protein
MDLSKLSDADLEALSAGDVGKMSDAALQLVAGKKGNESFNAGRESSLRGLYSVLQGPTFGFADEIGGAIGGGLKTLFGEGSLGDNYRSTRDFMRGAARQTEEDNPIFTGATRVAAGAPLMLLKALQAAPALGMGRNALQAGKMGAATGGLSGLGNSESETLGGALIDTAAGAATGGALGAGSVPLASAVGAAGRSVAGKFNDSAAGRYAQQKVSEALLQDARGKLANSSPDAAMRQVSNRIGQLGPEGRLVDAGGQNTRQLLDTLATLPGQTKSAAEAAIVARQAGRAGRLRGAAEASLNPSGLRLTETVDDLVARRSEAAKPLYENLYKTGVFVNDELKSLIEAANKLGAGSAGKQIATANRRPYTLEGSPQWAPMRELDYLKQGLDDIIEANKNEFGKLTKVGVSVQGLKRDLVDLLDQETKGAYKQARDAFAGPSALIDAAKDGRRVWSQDDTSITKALQSLSQGEQEAYKLGAAEALRQKLGNQGGQTEVMKMWRDKTTREKLQAVFGDKAEFDKFAASVVKEKRMAGLEAVGRGSQTAARQFGIGDLDVPAVSDAVQAVASAGRGSLPGFLTGAANLWNRVQTPEPVRNKMGEMLLSQGRSGRMTLQELEKAMREVAMNRSNNAGLLGLESGLLTGPMAGGLLGGR